MTSMLEKIKDKFKKVIVEHLIIFFAVIAVILIFASSFLDNSDSSENGSVESYVNQLENKLSQQLSKIQGAGKVTVIISVKGGTTTEIATEKRVTNDQNGIISEEYPVLVSGKPIILGEIYPEICGVIIIAKGADDVKVKIALMSAAQTFLDLTSDKIEILTMK